MDFLLCVFFPLVFFSPGCRFFPPVEFSLFSPTFHLSSLECIVMFSSLKRQMMQQRLFSIRRYLCCTVVVACKNMAGGHAANTMGMKVDVVMYCAFQFWNKQNKNTWLLSDEDFTFIAGLSLKTYCMSGLVDLSNIYILYKSVGREQWKSQWGTSASPLQIIVRGAQFCITTMSKFCWVFAKTICIRKWAAHQICIC